MNRKEIIGGIVIFIFGAMTTLLSFGMPIGNFRMPGTGMFPLLLGILLMVLSGLFLFKLIFQNKKALMKEILFSIGQLFPTQLILFFGTMVLATASIKQLGYPLTSFLLMVALLRILGTKHWGFILLLSFVTAVISYFLFVQWLKIPLPKGWMGL